MKKQIHTSPVIAGILLCVEMIKKYLKVFLSLLFFGLVDF